MFFLKFHLFMISNYDNGNHQENHGHQKLLDYQESVSSHFKHTGFVIDQTPTPTRFLKHYEDVSLFQDINLNPFDLEFRKASQNRSSKIYLTVTENHGISGSLDTPRILPPVESDETISSTSHDDSHVQVSTTRVQTQLSSIVTPVITEPEVTKHNSLSLPLVDRNEGRKRLTLNVSASEDGQTSNIISTPTPVITAGPSVSQSLGVGNLTPILNTPTIATSNIPQISLNGVGLGLNEIGSPKLKQVLSTSNTAAKPGSLRLSRASTADRIADLTKNKTTSSSNSGHGNISDGVKCLNSVDCNGPKGTRRRKSSPEEDPEEKRKKFLERNRVAAVRCREKKKRLVETMFARTDELNALNQKLQSEVVSLRSEVATLKCLLLKHKTCPVTLAMQGRENCYSDNIRDNETAFEIQNSTCVSQASIVQPMVQNISNTSLKISSQNISQDSSSFIVSEELPLDAANKFRKRSQSLSSISYPVPIQPILVNAQGVSTNETKAFAGVDVIKKEPKHILPKESPLLLSKNSLGNLASCSTSMSSTAQSNALSFSQSKIILLENTSLTNDVHVPSQR
ncbi:Cyclic AMP-dependent transcription factor ATF-2 [Armadillidium nasatum]|uniref:Cyclic AMP-dependent transcription factor ATF-2 n=1 Tax=Armadillidium nasatum TaxID=96803 RepID=A0A5N5SN11_9CRUS|nr:Cyclic AMP-dependent transcription factor ATF-2 [Armadillidium nasatum]